MDRLVALIVNFNRRALLMETVGSLRSQTRPPDEIIVVDNGSSDDSVAAVRRAAQEGGAPLRGLPLDENVGSAGGFAHGIAAALAGGATHLLVLDSDVLVAPDCVAGLRMALGRNPRLGVVGPRVYVRGRPGVLQMFGSALDWERACIAPHLPFHDEAASGAVTEDREVDFVPSCCLLATRAAVEAAGNFDPGWFLYWDDVDWCERVRRAGFGVAAIASASVQHVCGGANKRSLVPVYYEWRNRYTFFKRHAPVDRRCEMLRAVLEDHLLARFTCRTFGLVKTAAMMELGVEEALRGVFGRRDFVGVDVSLDMAAQPPVDPTAPVRSVHHVIGSATSELAAHPGVILKDRFGKRLPAAEAWALRQTFEVERERELPSLLARAMR